ncbi:MULTISPECIES: hypothetical protein [unclassified Marinovum]
MTGRFLLTCGRTGRSWRHSSRGMARQAALSLGLTRYTITDTEELMP